MPEDKTKNTRTIFFLVGLLLGTALLFWFLRSEGRQRFNVILICTDTVRYDTFWLVGSAGLEWDLLDSWLDRAIRFHKVQSVSPWTIPSLASVMTGLLPQRHGAGRFPGPVNDLSRQLPTGLPETIPTLAEILARAGYRTVNFSPHPWMTIEEFGLARGFQEEHTPTDDELLEDVFRWLLVHADADQPFFMNLHLMAAHDWHRAPARVIRHQLEGLTPILSEAAEQSGFPYQTASEVERLRFMEYVRAVAHVRNRLAKLLGTLNETLLLNQTVVLVYSDHGEEFREHLQQEKKDASDPRGIYGTGHGHSLFQELLHVPMMAWVPGREGVDSHYPSSLVDISPTLLGWLGLKEPASVWDGQDLSLYLDQPEATADSTRPLYSSGIAYGPPQSAILLGNLKMIRQGDEVRLYDLESDPGEQQPLEDPNDPLALELTRLLDQIESLEAEPSSQVPSISREQLERLRSLGYVSGGKR